MKYLMLHGNLSLFKNHESSRTYVNAWSVNHSIIESEKKNLERLKLFCWIIILILITNSWKSMASHQNQTNEMEKSYVQDISFEYFHESHLIVVGNQKKYMRAWWKRNIFIPDSNVMYAYACVCAPYCYIHPINKNKINVHVMLFGK